MIVGERERGRESTDPFGTLRPRKLVAFRERRKEGSGAGGDQLAYPEIVRRRLPPNVEQPDHAAQRRTGPEVALQPGSPAAAFRLAGAGVPVAGKIDEIEPAVERVDVEQPGLAGCGRYVRQAAAPDQRVEEARLADVGAADKGDLGMRRIELRIGIGIATDEANVAAQASFFCRGVCVTRRGGLPSVTVSRVNTTS